MAKTKTNKVVSKKNTPKAKALTEQEAFDLGWEAEQNLADSIVNAIPEDNSPEIFDAAFVGAFQGLVSRMLNFYSADVLVEILNDVYDTESQNHAVADSSKETLN